MVGFAVGPYSRLTEYLVDGSKSVFTYGYDSCGYDSCDSNSGSCDVRHGDVYLCDDHQILAWV